MSKFCPIYSNFGGLDTLYLLSHNTPYLTLFYCRQIDCTVNSAMKDRVRMDFPPCRNGNIKRYFTPLLMSHFEGSFCPSTIRLLYIIQPGSLLSTGLGRLSGTSVMSDTVGEETSRRVDVGSFPSFYPFFLLPSFSPFISFFSLHLLPLVLSISLDEASETAVTLQMLAVRPSQVRPCKLWVLGGNFSLHLEMSY